MSKADTIATLRRSLAKHGFDEGYAHVTSGHARVDDCLGGGLRIDAVHEIYAADASHAASACGFAAGFAQRLGRKKMLFWVAHEFALLEFGTPHANGFLELGLDPERLILLRMANGADALRAAADVLACSGIGALVLEISGAVKALDLTASRRLALATAENSVPAILLRLDAEPEASAAKTRWLVRARNSPSEEWDAPRFDVQLLRNRHGGLGHWDMEWDCSNGFFREPADSDRAPHHGHLAAAPADGSVAAKDARRRAV